MQIPQLAYCTNVHSGADWQAAVDNLKQYTLPVRESLCRSGSWQSGEPMGVGLWLAEPAARHAISNQLVGKAKEWLASQNLVPFTMNGFPYGNFHQPIVKHRVYQPTWWEHERRTYTEALVTILDQLLPAGISGSISTLPIAWGSPIPTPEQLTRAASNLCFIADYLDELFQRTGRCIVLAIEPEPGCYLTDNGTMRTFFRDYLLNDDSQSEKRRKYLTICHDICHAAVMREDQQMEFARHKAEGIRIGKVQVSSAIHVDWDAIQNETKFETFQQLRKFAEDRYLHQTTVQIGNRPAKMHEDLPALLASISNPTSLSGNWRIHFHVPIFYDHQIGALQQLSKGGLHQTELVSDFQGISTTQSEILRCLQLLESDRTQTNDHAMAFQEAFFTGHYEVETYAWTVLPVALRQALLVDDIAREMSYLKGLFDRIASK